MAEGEKGAILVGTAAGAGIGTLIGALLSKTKAGQPVDLTDVTSALLAIIDQQGQMLQALQAIAGSMGMPGGAMANPLSIAAFRIIPAGANVAMQLPNYEIPWDCQIVIKALPGNFGNAFTGRSAADVVNVNSRYLLIQNEGIGYKVKNASAIWVAVAIAGDGFVCTVEQASPAPG